MYKSVFSVFFILLLGACAATPPVIPVDTRSVDPGTKITRGGKTELALIGKPIRVGDPLPSVELVDLNLKRVDPSSLRGEVLLISIVPSLDTQVCERQTHLLGESKLPPGIRKLTISRDLPFAQKRFDDHTGFADVLYLSDFQKADFGKATGLLVDQIYLLARGVAVVDREGIVRYLQIVPEISHLPDMDAAIKKATELAAM